MNANNYLEMVKEHLDDIKEAVIGGALRKKVFLKIL